MEIAGFVISIFAVLIASAAAAYARAQALETKRANDTAGFQLRGEWGYPPSIDGIPMGSPSLEIQQTGNATMFNVEVFSNGALARELPRLNPGASFNVPNLKGVESVELVITWTTKPKKSSRREHWSDTFPER